MKIKLSDIKAFGTNLETLVKKYAPQILTTIGVGGLVTTTIYSVRVTPKALEALKAERERRVNEFYEKNPEEREAENKDEMVQSLEKLEVTDYIRLTWKMYLPSVLLAGASIGCIAGANHIYMSRNAALAAAYVLTEGKFDEYKEHVKKVFGEKKEKSVRESIAEDQVANREVEDKEIIHTGKGETLCYDPLAGRFFYSDIDAIKRDLVYLNNMLLSDDTVTLNDFYEISGLRYSRFGDSLGWNRDKDGLVELDLSSTLAEDGTPAVVIDFVSGPYYRGYGFDHIYNHELEW